MNEKYPLALPEGSVLAGQYIIERVLGQGGFGITYEAKDHKTGERVAVKEFFPDAMATRTNQTTVSAFSGERGESFAYGKTCFLQEAETLARFIGNENIVRIHSYFEENETAYFVMDFIEGTSFDEYLKERGGKIPFEEAAQILIPVMDALSAVHSQGIVHRDVTPDNIYITKEGVVKLLDFGAARYSLGDKSRSLDIILKHGFAPKEQYTRRGKQGPYTDVYALGATFYFALTGKRPPDSVERLDEDDLVPPSSLGVQISDAAEDAILQALSVQPGDRFQSMMAFKNALMNVQQAAQPPLAAVGSRPTVSQTYFNAPDQTGIPHSASMGGPAPGSGQNSELQDLASTMKTAGVLAGKLAGKMAGKVAEKTAETAGVMAGTAGKMSEIMAAKKAEAAEKLAAKMAEREAEKAAREAERAAQREAAEAAAAEAARQAAAEAEAARQAAAEAAAAEAARQAAAETAWNTAENTAESSVGRTVGAVPGSTAGYTYGTSPDIPPSSPPAKPSFNKKLLLIPAGAVAAIGILVGVFVLKPGDTAQTPPPKATESAGPAHTAAPTQEVTPDPNTFETPEPTATPEPAKAPTGNVALVGSTSAANIMNGGIFTSYNSTEYSIIDGGREIIISGSDSRIRADDGATFSNLMVVDGKLYVLESTGLGHGYMSTYDLNTREIVALDTLNINFTYDISQVLMTEDYYFIGWRSGNTEVYRVSRSDLSDVVKCCVTDTMDGLSSTFTLSSDGWLYYTARENDQSGIRRMRADTLEVDDLRFVYNTYSNILFGNPIIVGDYLYVSMYDSEGSYYSIIRMDRENGYDKELDPIWVVSDELGTDIQPYGCGFNVNASNGEIYFSLYGVDDDYPDLYRMTGYDDGTFDASLVASDAFRPNLSYYTDGGYDLSFYHLGADDEDFGQYYIQYDSNGNKRS